MNLYYKKIKKQQSKYSVVWKSTRRFMMVEPARGGGGGGAGAGGNGGNGGTCILITSNLTPTTSSPLGTYTTETSYTDGSRTMKCQAFANFDVSAGGAGGAGTGGTAGTGAAAGGLPTAANAGKTGIAFVVFI